MKKVFHYFVTYDRLEDKSLVLKHHGKEFNPHQQNAFISIFNKISKNAIILLI